MNMIRVVIEDEQDNWGHSYTFHMVDGAGVSARADRDCSTGGSLSDLARGSGCNSRIWAVLWSRSVGRLRLLKTEM